MQFPRVSKSRLYLIFSVPLMGAVFMGAVLIVALDGRAPAEPPASLTTRVRVEDVQQLTWNRQLALSGVSRAAQRARLSFTVGGRLLERPVETGQRVAAGDVLARMDAEPYRNAADAALASVREMEVRLAQLERDQTRAAQLKVARAVTEEEFEQINSAVQSLRSARDAAASQLEEARRKLEETILRAPFAGIVAEVLHEPGEVLSPGAPVLFLSGLGDFEVEVEVPERVIVKLATGDSVPVELPLLGWKPVVGKIISVGQAATGPGRLFPVLIALEAQPGMRSGLTASVSLSVIEKARLTVPLASIVDPGGGHPAVFAVRGGRARRLEVIVDGLTGERVVVDNPIAELATPHSSIDKQVAMNGPLRAGDQVVVGGHASLLDGQLVEVMR